LTRKRFAGPPQRAYDGIGAARSGQRWNARGTRAAYASATLSLAALEYLGTLVDLDDAPNDLVCVAAEFDEAVVEIADPRRIEGWNATPPDASVAFGTRWLHERRSVVLRVPSVMIPREANFVLNPEHPNFAGAVRIAAPEAFAFDARLLRRRAERRPGPINDRPGLARTSAL
jgi:RES domain-containing protein